MPIMFKDTCQICGVKFDNMVDPQFAKLTCGSKECIKAKSAMTRKANKLKKEQEAKANSDNLDQLVNGMDDGMDDGVDDDLNKLVDEIESDYNSTTHSDKYSEPICIDDINTTFDEVKKEEKKEKEVARQSIYMPKGLYS